MNGSVNRLMPALALVWLITSGAATAASQPADGVAARLQMVRSWIDLGRYVEAEAEAERLLLTLRESADPEGLETRASDLLVEALVRNGRGAEPRARELAELTVQTKASRLGSEHPSLATSLRNLGDVLFQSGDSRLATARFRQALALMERPPVAAASDVAEILDRLALTLTESGQYDEASGFANRALAFNEQARDPRGVAIARTLQIRGLLLQTRGDFARARPDFERSLTLHEAVHPQHPETATALNLFGAELLAEGDLVQARQVLTRAVSLAEVSLRPDHPDIALFLRTLARSLLNLGDLAGARSMSERALTIAEKAFGADHPKVGDQLNDLANALLLQGEYSAARPLYERSLGIVEKRFGANHFEVGVRVYNLAIVLRRLGDLNEARRQFERAIQTWSRTVGPQHPSVASALSTLAETLADHGLHTEARLYFERALAIRERALGPDHPLVAATLSDLSVSLARLGFVRRASELSARSLRIREQTGAIRGLAASLEVHARLLAEQSDYVGARLSYQRVLEMRRPLLGGAHPLLAETEIRLAGVEARLGSREEALARALRGEEIGRDHLRLTLGSLAERQALDFAAQRPQGLELALSLTSSAQASGPVLDAVIRGRSLILDEIAGRRQALAGPVGKLAPLWTTLGSARQRLANLIIRGPSDRNSEQYTKLVDEARREKEIAERALAEQSAAFRAELERAEIGLEQVRGHLLPGNALISFVRYDRTVFGNAPSGAARPASAPALPVGPTRIVPSYMAFVLRPDAVDPIIVPLGRADRIETLIGSWRQTMTADIARPRGAPPSNPSFRSIGVTLRGAIWDPVAAHLSDVSRVFVVPDGSINLVPLAALASGRTGYLLEDGPTIHYLSAERDLVMSAEPKTAAGSGLLVVGGPSFVDGSSFAALARPARVPALPPPSLTAASSFRGAPSACGSFQSMQFDPLPGSGQEARTVAGLWQQMGTQTTVSAAAAQILTGPDATERAFKQLGPGQRVLHLATHGFFLGDECASALDGTRAVGGLTSASKSATANGPARPAAGPRRAAAPENPLVHSGLALAGANRRVAAGPEEDDGILTGEEVAALNLEGVEWAVLSACDTGLGELRAGEGVLGLRRAFQVAGARTVIMSLWSVEDRATRQWMEALYRGRLSRGLDTADAVREASLSVLRDRRAKGLSSHPFYWGGFVAAGDWR